MYGVIDSVPLAAFALGYFVGGAPSALALLPITLPLEKAGVDDAILWSFAPTGVPVGGVLVVLFFPFAFS